jgi:hypothetical protein
MHASAVHELPSTNTSVSSSTLTTPPAPSHSVLLQSPEACDEITVPALACETPQAPALQVRIWHSVSAPAQSLGVLHSTHEPEPSHTAPPFWSHPAPEAMGGFEGVPFEHTSLVHELPSMGMSALSMAIVTPPEPSHCACLQSPAVWAASLVPAAAYEKPHAPAMQVRVWHSVSWPGHPLAAMHSTHAPATPGRLR